MQALLCKEDVLDQVLHDHTSKDTVFRDYYDGSFIKNSTQLQSTNSLFMAFYYDELEVVNPLGSSKGIHKIGQKIL